MQELGPLQKDWLEIQERLRKLYTFLGPVPQVPSEESLKVLDDCPLTMYSSRCFDEGCCLDPDDPNCALRASESST